MSTVTEAIPGGKIARDGPNRKSSWSSYNGSCVACGPVRDGEFVGVYNDNHAVEMDGELLADTLLWQPPSWRAFLDLIIRDTDFRANLLNGNASADFEGLTASRIHDQRFEQRLLVDDAGNSTHEWQLFDKRGSEGDQQWAAQSVILRFTPDEMEKFVFGVLDGDCGLTQQYDQEVRAWQASVEPATVVQELGHYAFFDGAA